MKQPLKRYMTELTKLTNASRLRIANNYLALQQQVKSTAGAAPTVRIRWRSD